MYLPADGKGKIGLALAIPIGANIGGIGTPIGTPPNAIALKYLNDPDGMNLGIGFGQWMLVMLPLALSLLFIAWFILKTMFLPISTPPNALADASGFIKQKDMVTTGLIMGTIGLILGYIVLMTFGQVVLL